MLWFLHSLFFPWAFWGKRCFMQCDWPAILRLAANFVMLAMIGWVLQFTPRNCTSGHSLYKQARLFAGVFEVISLLKNLCYISGWITGSLLVISSLKKFLLVWRVNNKILRGQWHFEIDIFLHQTCPTAVSTYRLTEDECCGCFEASGRRTVNFTDRNDRSFELMVWVRLTVSNFSIRCVSWNTR